MTPEEALAALQRMFDWAYENSDIQVGSPLYEEAQEALEVFRLLSTRTEASALKGGEEGGEALERMINLLEGPN